MKWLKRFGIFLLVLLGLLVLVALLLRVLYRDLSVAEIEQRYYPDAVPAIAEINGIGLRYQVQGSGPPVLLLHSHFFNMRMWDAWVEELSGEFTLIRFDLPGHGLTGPDPSADYGMERSVELVAGFLDQLEIDSAYLVGSSLGGNFAFNFAAQHPERVKKLVLINSGGMKREGSRAGSEVPGWADTAFYLLPRFAFRAFLEWVIIDDAQVDDALVAEFHDMFRREGNRPAEMERLRDFQVEDPDPVLAGITAPTLIIWGENNPQLPAELADGFRTRLVSAPQVQVILLEGIGHVVPLEAPQESAQITAEFLNGDSLQ
jgi:pimeloyl-ACP methyl ester carboxylesterase